MPTVRLTNRPDLDVEVSDAELVDLQRWGLLVDNPPTSDPAPATTNPKPAKGPLTTKEA